MKEVLLTAVDMNLPNIVGNAVLINGLFGMPRLGTLGAAFSTDFSECVGLLILLAVSQERSCSSAGLLFAAVSSADFEASAADRVSFGRWCFSFEFPLAHGSGRCWRSWPDHWADEKFME